jgi:hypothetical protein
MEQKSESDEVLDRIKANAVEAERILEILKTNESEVEKLHTSASKDNDAITVALATVKNTLTELETMKTKAEGSAETFTASLKTLKDKADVDASALEAIFSKAALLEGNVESYTKQIETLITDNQSRFVELSNKIEGLLPGATSARLASAFEGRKDAIVTSQLFWKWSFYTSLTVSVVVGYCLLSVYLPLGGDHATAVDWTQFVRGIVPRLLLLSPLFWLAGFSARQLSVRFRLEEDYAHKEALSRAFEGYKREMTTMNDSGGAAANLANAVITALGEAPVRLYDSHISSDSPPEKLKDLLTSTIKPKQ